MRPLFAVFAFLAAAGLGAASGDPRLVRVWPELFSSDLFQSFHEFRTGRELTGRWIILRSRPEERSGLYFVTRIVNPGAALSGTSFVLHLISPESTDTRVFSFPAGIPAGKQLFEIGLTGRDWAGPRVYPVAWELELQSADGRVIAKKSSFLWEKPGR